MAFSALRTVAYLSMVAVPLKLSGNQVDSPRIDSELRPTTYILAVYMGITGAALNGLWSMANIGRLLKTVFQKPILTGAEHAKLDVSVAKTLKQRMKLPDKVSEDNLFVTKKTNEEYLAQLSKGKEYVDNGVPLYNQTIKLIPLEERTNPRLLLRLCGLVLYFGNLFSLEDI